jgi:hypothetical protein
MKGTEFFLELFGFVRRALASDECEVFFLNLVGKTPSKATERDAPSAP